MKSIGIQGGKGSFSEQAAHEFSHNHGLEGADIIYQISSESVLTGVETGETDYGILAMENAQGGVAIESVEALAKYRCDIIEMFHIPVDQNILGLPYRLVRILDILICWMEIYLNILVTKLIPPLLLTLEGMVVQL